uniref:Lipocalin/cytosolic fatty-acid binding domain-containing protein n=1 Tax=Amblyomma maculatum TaxID=34609 RepID=G3MKS8_AMBMU
MGFTIWSALAFAVILCGLPRVAPKGVSRMAMYENYADYQDIEKAFNTSSFYWLYATNTHFMPINANTCLGFNILGISSSGLNYSTTFMEGNNSHTDREFGNFYSWPMISKEDEVVKRNKANAIYVKEGLEKNKILATNFSLLFSDYQNCIILLLLEIPIVLDKHNPLNLDNYANKCIVLLTDTAARNGMNNTISHSYPCQSVFYNACLRYKIGAYEELFDNACPKPQTEVPPAC